MNDDLEYLSKTLLLLEIIAAIVGLLYLKKVKNSYWKYFVYYLVFVAFSELFIEKIIDYLGVKKQLYFAYIGIPIEFVFFFWLFAFKSLGSKKIFWFSTIIYFLSFIPIELYFEKLNVIFSFNYTIGTLVLMVLVFLEFKKQIQNDSILEFYENKMFYINIGVILFYIGTLPFFGLYNLLLKEPDIWNYYYIYFLISNCIMYMLFSASFIWGKTK